MTRDKVLEHMARAAYASASADTHGAPAWDDLPESVRTQWVRTQEAALTALEAAGVKLCEGEPAAWKARHYSPDIGYYDEYSDRREQVQAYGSIIAKPLYRAIATGREE